MYMSTLCLYASLFAAIILCIQMSFLLDVAMGMGLMGCCVHDFTSNGEH